MISLENVTYSYSGQTKPVIVNLNMNINPGEITVILGPNGSGKSTLAQLLNGIILPDSGRILVDSQATSSEASIWNIRRKVGLILQNPDNQLLAPTVEEDVAFGPENLGVEPAEIGLRIKAALAAVGMSEYIHWPPSRLSGGQKQRVAIAGILAMHPDYLILDEATSMLDPKGRKEILKVVTDLAQQGIGIVMITHHMDEAVLADRLVILNSGTVALAGTPREVLTDGEALEKYGLAAPPIQKIVMGLRAGGLAISPTILRADELVKALC